jgi:hypothetical protein
VLTNPAYVARRVHHGEVVADATWPPLVHVDDFERAQARLEARQDVKQGATPRLLTGVARCGVCSGRMACGKDRLDRRIYQCRNGFHVARDMRRLDAWVEEIVVDRLSRPDAADALEGAPDPAAGEARKRAEGLRAELDEAMGLWKAKKLSATRFAEMEQELLPQIAEAEREARRALVPLDIDVPTEGLEEWWERELEREQKREIIGALIAAVVVHPVGKGRRNFDPADVTDVEWRR